MTDRRRVVVTGMGMVTTLGNDVPTTWANLVAGRSGIRTIQAFDPSRLTVRIAAEVRDFDASGLLDRKELRRTDRCIQLGLVATREALDQAGLPERFEGDLAERTGVILGTGLGGVGTLIDGFVTNALRGPDRISPSQVEATSLPRAVTRPIPVTTTRRRSLFIGPASRCGPSRPDTHLRASRGRRWRWRRRGRRTRSGGSRR